MKTTRKTNLSAAVRKASVEVAKWPQWKRGGSAAAAKIARRPSAKSAKTR